MRNSIGYTRECKILRHHSAVYQIVRSGGGGFLHNLLNHGLDHFDHGTVFTFHSRNNKASLKDLVEWKVMYIFVAENTNYQKLKRHDGG